MFTAVTEDGSSTPTTKKPPWKLILVAAIAVFVIWAFATDSDDAESTSRPTGPTDQGARDVCHQFVEQRLRAPATADFEDLGAARFTQTGSTDWKMTGHVDAENGFGAKIRSDYTCQVRHVAGTRWQLVDLNIEGR